MTNRYPQGQLNEHDDGELDIMMSIENNVVRIDFGKPVAWLGLQAREARQLAYLLLKRAEELK